MAEVVPHVSPRISSFLFPVQLDGLFDEVDDNHDGQLHYTEFLAATLETRGEKVAEDRLAEAFEQLDMDDSGVISKGTLVRFLGKDCKVVYNGCGWFELNFLELISKNE